MGIKWKQHKEWNVRYNLTESDGVCRLWPRVENPKLLQHFQGIKSFSFDGALSGTAAASTEAQGGCLVKRAPSMVLAHFGWSLALFLLPYVYKYNSSDTSTIFQSSSTHPNSWNTQYRPYISKLCRSLDDSFKKWEGIIIKSGPSLSRFMRQGRRKWDIHSMWPWSRLVLTRLSVYRVYRSIGFTSVNKQISVSNPD